MIVYLVIGGLAVAYVALWIEAILDYYDNPQERQ